MSNLQFLVSKENEGVSLSPCAHSIRHASAGDVEREVFVKKNTSEVKYWATTKTSEPVRTRHFRLAHVLEKERSPIDIPFRDARSNIFFSG
jgi:hypothetical protein